ncbi:MAG: membrane protein insertase YidC [Flavobacteriales bacterium]|nr:membrane protein insertase YidC [Flavobacteriales bacterium]
MDRNTIIGLVLIAAIFIGFQIINAPSKEEIAAAQAAERRYSDSLALVQEEQARKATDTSSSGTRNVVTDPFIARVKADSTISDSTRTARIDSAHQADLLGRFGIFNPSSTGTDEAITLENEKLQVTIRTKGARPALIRLKDYRTWSGKPLLLADPDSSSYEYRFFLGNRDISTKDLHFTAEKLGTTGVRLKAPTNDPSKYLAITYQLDSADWMMRVNAELIGLENEVNPGTVMFHWDITGLQNEKHLPTEQGKCTVFYKYMSEDRNYLSETGDESLKLEGRTNWVAFKQDFFTVAMIKPDGFTANGSEISIKPLPAEGQHTKRYSARLFFDQPASPHASLTMDLYLGPNHFNTLRRTDIPEFERIIDLGWGIFGWVNRFIVIPVFNFLGQFKLSYGIIILVLTIAIKLVLMPIAFRNQKSSARMRALKPEIEAINKKFPNPDDMMKRNTANMELYRKAGVSPMAGCVPMLLQMPILYAMFRFFPASIELRQQSFLWADDLSSYDSIATLPFTVPFNYGNHVSLFTILMAASTMIYTLISSKQMPQQQGMPSMKIMMYIFPVMMLFFMNSLPAGLSYYYLLANLISILQMTLLGRFFINEEKLREELLVNMSKPKKKSKWQQRIEEMQKQQQATRKR